MGLIRNSVMAQLLSMGYSAVRVDAVLRLLFELDYKPALEIYRSRHKRYGISLSDVIPP